MTAKDFKIDYYCASGNGGQNRNRRSTAVRMTHEPSGCVQTCCNEREQLKNKRKCFELLCNQPKFREWLRVETMRKIGSTVYEAKMNEIPIEQKVDEMMKPEYIKQEYFKP